MLLKYLSATFKRLHAAFVAKGYAVLQPHYLLFYSFNIKAFKKNLKTKKKFYCIKKRKFYIYNYITIIIIIKVKITDFENI